MTSLVLSTVQNDPHICPECAVLLVLDYKGWGSKLVTRQACDTCDMRAVSDRASARLVSETHQQQQKQLVGFSNPV